MVYLAICQESAFENRRVHAVHNDASPAKNATTNVAGVQQAAGSIFKRPASCARRGQNIANVSAHMLRPERLRARKASVPVVVHTSSRMQELGVGLKVEVVCLAESSETQSK